MSTPADHAPSTVDVLVAVVRLETKVDGLTAQVTNRDTVVEERFRDHEARIRILERARWPIASVALLLSAAGVWATIAPHWH